MKTLNLIFLLFVISPLSQTATIYVDDSNTTGPWNGSQQYPYQFIQDGISAASNSDTVLVSKGIYYEDIKLFKTITVKSEDGPKSTFIVGSHNDDVVEISNAVLDGFTIGNGGGSYYGSGIYCTGNCVIRNNVIKANDDCGIREGIYGSSGPIIVKNNTITGNLNSGIFTVAGGHIINNNINSNGFEGITCWGQSTIIENNSITNNAWTGIRCEKNVTHTIINNCIKGNMPSPYHGGGIHCRDCFPIIAYNTITENSGCGIEIENCANTLINNNIITNNLSTSYPGGIQVFAHVGDTIDIINNIISDNIGYGGGAIALSIFNQGFADVYIINNTIVNNTATSHEGVGAISCYNTNCVVTNSIIWGNHASKYPGIKMGEQNAPSTLSIDHSDFEGGQAAIVYTPGCTLNWGPGMIDADPVFENASSGDYHLSWISSCINRGTNVGAPGEDIDGETRPHMGTTDIGADEFTGTHALEADLFNLPEATGGTVNFHLNGSTDNAQRTYMIFGSITGTAPGTPIPGGYVTLPINWDIFTNLVLNLTNTPVFLGFMGKLDITGNASAQLKLGPMPGTAGISMYFAYALNIPWDFVSNPVAIEIVP